MRILGILILIAGLISIFYFQLSFDVTVELSPIVDLDGYENAPERIANINLLAQRTDYTLLSGIAFLAGLMIYHNSIKCY